MARTLSWLCTRVAPLALLPGVLLAQQPAIVTGRVADEAGKPIALATVALPALGVGATTRQNGEYTILIPAARATGQQTALTARIIGYKPQSVLITLREGTVNQDFALASNPLQLGEIVVTGAGTETTVEKYANVRNSVSEELIKKSNESNLVQALAGKAPNVQVSQNSGEPGAGSFITIRGIRTVNGRLQPLMVVDGTPVDNSTYTTGRFNALTPGALPLAPSVRRKAPATPTGARTSTRTTSKASRSSRARRPRQSTARGPRRASS
jgi:carboxypeptidase-like protein/TonB-dependent receptor-like protein